MNDVSEVVGGCLTGEIATGPRLTTVRLAPFSFSRLSCSCAISFSADYSYASAGSDDLAKPFVWLLRRREYKEFELPGKATAVWANGPSYI